MSAAHVRQGTRAAPHPPVACCPVGRQVRAYGTIGQKNLATMATWPAEAGVEGDHGRLLSSIDSYLVGGRGRFPHCRDDPMPFCTP